MEAAHRYLVEVSPWRVVLVYREEGSHSSVCREGMVYSVAVNSTYL